MRNTTSRSFCKALECKKANLKMDADRNYGMMVITVVQLNEMSASDIKPIFNEFHCIPALHSPFEYEKWSSRAKSFRANWKEKFACFAYPAPHKLHVDSRSWGIQNASVLQWRFGTLQHSYQESHWKCTFAGGLEFYQCKTWFLKRGFKSRFAYQM